MKLATLNIHSFHFTSLCFYYSWRDGEGTFTEKSTDFYIKFHLLLSRHHYMDMHHKYDSDCELASGFIFFKHSFTLKNHIGWCSLTKTLFNIYTMLNTCQNHTIYLSIADSLIVWMNSINIRMYYSELDLAAWAE